MTASLRIDPGDPAPPYEQVLRQVLEHVAAGRLAEGARMPPVRQLAGDLGIAAGTVARAYRELEGRGVIRTRRGGGTTVAPGARSAASTPPAPQPMPPAVLAAVTDARARGIADDAIAAAVVEALGGLATD